MCRAATSLSGLLLFLRLLAITGDPLIGSISRHYKGDMFVAGGSSCDENACVGSSSGTAVAVDQATCTCQCLPHLTVFRDDLHICIDDIHECSLAPFVSGTTSQMIPFVFLPLRGQIVYPSAEITFVGVAAPICVVSSAQFLTRGGWVDIRNNSFLEPPFRLFRDEGRTFLQWLGDQDLRLNMEGRLILVHLMCKDMGATPVNPQQYIFTPCVAFRVAGTPSVREVSFSADAHAAEDASKGLSVSEYVAIGVCSVLLGLIYVASVFLYLHVRRRRKGGSVADKHRSFRGSPNLHLAVGEDGVVKSNPLLQAKRQRHAAPSENPCYHSESASGDSDSDQDHNAPCEDDMAPLNVQVTSALVHSCNLGFIASSEECCYNAGFPLQDANSFERLPEQNVSIVETLDGREERSETVRAISNGTFRRKLYFNPEYFELELLMDPPPGAVEFLTKIREVILIARHKMMAKRFSPSLPGIPEEDVSGSVLGGELVQYCGASSRRSSGTVSLKRQNSRVRGCTGCPGCKVMPELLRPCCTSDNTESKQSSIRKWLEDVPIIKTESPHKNVKSDSPETTGQTHMPKIVALKERFVNPLGDRVPQDMITSCRSGPPFTNKDADSLNTESPAPCYITDAVPKQYTSNNQSPDIKGYQGTTSPTPSGYNLERTKSECKGNSKDVSLVKNYLMDAVIKELEVVGHRGSETDSPLPQAQPDIPSIETRNKRLRGFYDTDSLERSEAFKDEESGFQTPSDYGDVNSQQSPCLGSALPMEEEMVMRNDVFNKKTGNKTISKLKMNKPSAFQSPEEHDYEIMLLNPTGEKDKKLKLYSLPELFNNNNNNNKGYSLVSEVYVNDEYNFSSTPSSPGNTSSTSCSSAGTKIRYIDEKKPGHLTIELEDSPENYLGTTNDSDEFEPDTLDRKPVKTLGNGYALNTNHAHQRYSENFIDSLERNSQILLRTNGSFRSDSIGRSGCSELEQITRSSPPLSRTFGSLREIYEARNNRNLHRESDNASIVGSTRSIYSDTTDCNYTLSRQRTCNIKNNKGYREIQLNPDSRHARRQRRPTPPGTVKSYSKLAPPDLIPPRPPKAQSLIYEHPPPPKRVHTSPPLPSRNNKPPLPPKNGIGRSTSHKSTLSFPTQRPLPPLPHNNSRRGSTSSTSSASRDSETPITAALSSASADSLNSSDYETFCTFPYSKDEQTTDYNDFEKSVTKSEHVLKPPDVIRRCELKSQVTPKVSQQPYYKGHERIPTDTKNVGGAALSDINSTFKVQDCLNKHRKAHLQGKTNRESVKQTWRRVMAKSSHKGLLKPEDSGYLSTDSDESKYRNPGLRQVKRVPQESVSDTDESLCDGASESGGESIATDSFFFGTCRKPATITGSVDSGVGSELIRPISHSVLIEDAGENTSDSENVSFVTVLSPTMSRRSEIIS